MSGRSNTKDIHVVTEVGGEVQRAEKEFAFGVYQKVYIGVPCAVICDSLEAKGILQTYIEEIQGMYI